MQYYTRALRAKENDAGWVLRLQEEAHATFPAGEAGVGASEWGACLHDPNQRRTRRQLAVEYYQQRRGDARASTTDLRPTRR